MPSAPARSGDLSSRASTRSGAGPPVGAHRARIGAALKPCLALLGRRFARTGRRGRRPARLGFRPVRRLLDRLVGGCLGNLVVDVSGSVSPTPMRSRTRVLGRRGLHVVGDDRDLAGQFGDRHRVGVSAATAAAGRSRGANRAVLGQQLGHRNGSGGVRFGPVISCRRIPIGSLITSISHGSLYEGGSVGFAIEFAKNEALP